MWQNLTCPHKYLIHLFNRILQHNKILAQSILLQAAGFTLTTSKSNRSEKPWHDMITLSLVLFSRLPSGKWRDVIRRWEESPNRPKWLKHISNLLEPWVSMGTINLRKRKCKKTKCTKPDRCRRAKQSNKHTHREITRFRQYRTWLFSSSLELPNWLVWYCG